ncbi:glutathione synthase [Gammaproteobacteria bacterium]|jgi:glutathione synthase|nr:glutathione synthase [Gammaproteobacteria bacterium]MDA8981824.1 glutathione synthase [Gammaproteobacteria bacterium]MDA9143104.1 glutathione synthase [Gammaproteobacteria bacterium]MDA9997221.1 glutathione synthase [Gammaproteobacteria bacterium]MDC0367181.1 glutathione synthase [Gammaproteobacteria bacterium]
MKKSFLFITDTFSSLNHKKDTSIFMMEEALNEGVDVYQCEMKNIFALDNLVNAHCFSINSNVSISINPNKIALNDFSSVFMRKDPPVDENYINCLHLLSTAVNNGANIHNDPSAIKEFNEKVFALHFSDFIPKTIITADINQIKEFQKKYQTIVVKPLDGMGGVSIHKFDDINEDAKDILLNMTNKETTTIIGQEFLPEIYDGDFRILIIHGKPFPKTLARIPQDGNFKGNLAAGGKGVVADLTPAQKDIANKVAIKLLDSGINFAGIDMIGDKLTEINITSPTCAREIYIQSGENPIKEYIKGL